MYIIKKYRVFKESVSIEDEISYIWNPYNSFNSNREPKDLGEIQNKSGFSARNKLSVLDMVIKVPNGDIKIPFDDKSIQEVVDRVVKYETSINSNFSQYYMYLTVHQSNIESGKSQRRGGAHIDGMQGDRYADKLPICHSYIISDETPTIFHTNKFDVNDINYKHNWFNIFQKQVNDREIVVTKPYHIYFLNAYNVHSATKSNKDTYRTFMRIEFSLKKFDRDGNTINPLLSNNWEFTNRDIPSNLL